MPAYFIAEIKVVSHGVLLLSHGLHQTVHHLGGACRARSGRHRPFDR